MKIEIRIIDSKDVADYNQSTCFEADSYIKDNIKNMEAFGGFITIDDVRIPFWFSPAGMDGNIKCDVKDYRVIAKRVIPLYAFNRPF